MYLAIQMNALNSRPPPGSTWMCLRDMHLSDAIQRRLLLSGTLYQRKTNHSEQCFSDFFFGCGQNNQGPFGNTAGVIGLGRHPLSIISQTAPKYGKYFSYCPPSTSSQTGYLTLGKIGLSNNEGMNYQYSPNRSAFKTIIDSMTVITRLPPKAYSTLRDEFKQMMLKYPTTPRHPILDMCYDLSGHGYVTIPVITIVFGGNVRVDLAPSGIVIVISSTRFCLAFSANDYEIDVGIFRNTQQKTLEVVYDVGRGYLGFGPSGCK
ncbi:Nepenthesin [Handroanthus impetiginosus]|uniref:Nepenthesin n=1 Tax=Handroanthus impetiginosus TaxID=429701 RepID=A0A2G9H8R4_9LAMI|nr:Nepenthesin [Handroanthus impetiginosus]